VIDHLYAKERNRPNGTNLAATSALHSAYFVLENDSAISKFESYLLKAFSFVPKTLFANSIVILPGRVFSKIRGCKSVYIPVHFSSRHSLVLKVKQVPAGTSI